MRKLLCAVLLFAAVGIVAQAPPPVAPLPSFEVYLGVGQVATSESGNAIAYTANWQTQLTAGFRWFPTERFAIEGQYYHDTVSIAHWLTVHNFTPYKQVDAYKYSTLAVQAEYWVVRGKTGGIYAFIAPQYFFSTQGQNGALGYAVGAGAQWAFWRGVFIESKVQFWHVQNYLVPVANVGEASLSLGYRF